MKIFWLKRLSGLTQILNGVVYVFVGKSTGLPLVVARKIAYENCRRLIKEQNEARTSQ